ncbi:potassium uptake [Lecanosticta acicola]|uniref:Potassium uptake n=1 Tax=Lecanosticta acicola TaxID=111012 RepID=A0AAI8Z8Z3_9PEZI|nr:potassium uptake [Lecanosticta acicola]
MSSSETSCAPDPTLDGSTDEKSAATPVIHFADQAHFPRRSEDGPVPETNTLDHGIAFTSAHSFGVYSARGRSVDHRRSSIKNSGVVDEEALHHPADVKQKQTFTKKQLFFLAYQSIGIIYGDIGTSPLYVFSSTFTDPNISPSRADIIGVLSLIIWSLLLIVTLKYVVIILNADNEGEGGTFSCYSLLSRYANITNRDPREKALVRIDRHLTNDLSPGNKRLRDVLENSKIFKGILKAMGVYAVSMVMSDGVLTPAQSVLGAVQGISLAAGTPENPVNISNGVIVGTTCAILVLLFMIQPLGTTRIGVTFAPIIMMWLMLLACFGIYNIVKWDAGVFVAFNPGEAFGYLIRNGEAGWRSLGGVLLAFTGVEALFADLGAFSMRAIQMSWIGYCLPCLLLTYIGQAAYIVDHPVAAQNPVFATVPGGRGSRIFTLILAILAAIVASQAIITATFQLLAQIVKLSYFPQIEVKHTSKKYHNQLYVPLVNYLLCIGTVVVTAVFRNTTSLGQAYGVCVIFVTFFDTQMTTLVSLLVWKFPWWSTIVPWLAFSALDGAFLSSALTKVPDGAWFTLTLASVLAAIFIIWRFGKEQQWSAERKDSRPLSSYVKRGDNNEFVLVGSDDNAPGEELSIIHGAGIFFDKTGDMTPMVVSQFLNKLASAYEVTVFFHLRAVEYPTVDPEQRFIVRKLNSLPHCYRVVARYGYMQDLVTDELARVVQAEIETTLPQDSEDLAVVRKAFGKRILYVVGKEEMVIGKKTSWFRYLLVKTFLFIRENTRKKMDNLKVPSDKLMETGFIVEI